MLSILCADKIICTIHNIHNVSIFFLVRKLEECAQGLLNHSERCRWFNAIIISDLYRLKWVAVFFFNSQLAQSINGCHMAYLYYQSVWYIWSVEHFESASTVQKVQSLWPIWQNCCNFCVADSTFQMAAWPCFIMCLVK